VAAKYILAILALLFLLAALWRLVRNGGKLQPQSRTWLIVAAVFAAVSVWLWFGH
jgi:hypothetical protein